MKNRPILKAILSLIALSITLTSCVTGQKKVTDPLPSWNDGKNKEQIISFVNHITDPKNPQFIEEKDRIAVFDNDGTLWTEKPLYNHFFGIFAKMEAEIAKDPSLLQDPVFKSIDTFIKTNDPKDLAFFMEEYKNQDYLDIIGQLFGYGFKGMSPNEFTQWNRDFYKTWSHPKYKKGVSQLTYKPMKELISYLKSHNFKVYISTADEGAFLKGFSEELYGVPPENIIGSSVDLDYKDGETFRSTRGLLINNWEYKAKTIQQIIGQKPIFAAGNSNGDFHMLEYSNTQERAHLCLLIHHTDGEREAAYDSHTEKVLPFAQEHGYTIVDMAKDWKVVW